MIDIILGGTGLFVLGIMYSQMRRLFDYNMGQVLYTHIPIEDRDRPSLVDFLKGSKRTYQVLNLILGALILMTGLVFPEKYKALSYIIILYLGIFGLMAYLQVCILAFRRRKEREGIHVGTKAYVDPKASRVLEQAKLPAGLWALPLLIFFLGYLVLELVWPGQDRIFFFVNLSLMLSIYAMAFGLSKVPVKPVSKDTERNIFLNKKRSLALKEACFGMAGAYSILLLLSAYLVHSDPYKVVPILGLQILPILAFTLYILKKNKEVDREISREMDQEGIYLDEGDYFDILGYKNPKDQRIMVADPLMVSNLTINRGNKKGKAIFYTGSILLALTLTLSLFAIIPIDYSFSLGEDYLDLRAHLYRDRVYYKDIEAIYYRDSFPEGHVVKTNGVADDYQANGDFSIQGKGPVRFYLYQNQEEMIEIQRKGQKPIYLNLEDSKDLKDLYHDLDQKIKK